MSKLFKPFSLVLSLALAVTLSGCGGSNSTPTESSSAAPSAATSTTTGNVINGALGELKIPTDIPDAHTLKGLTDTKALPPVRPIVNNAKPQLPVTITDYKNNKVTVKDASRIIALDIYGTTSETLIALGLASHIVGRTISDEDPAIAKVPVVTGKGHDINVEAIMAANPTLVFTNRTLGSATLSKTLRDSGITVVELNPDRNDELIGPQIQAIADAVGLSDLGKKLTERVHKELDEVHKYVQALAAKTKPEMRTVFLYVRGTAGVFFIFGKGSAAGPLIKDLGADDVAGKGGLGSIVPANAEALVKLNPEVILVMKDGLSSAGGLDTFLKRPGMMETVAGQNKRIISTPDAQLLSFGPQYPAALKVLADAFYLGK